MEFVPYLCLTPIQLTMNSSRRPPADFKPLVRISNSGETVLKHRPNHRPLRNRESRSNSTELGTSESLDRSIAVAIEVLKTICAPTPATFQSERSRAEIWAAIERCKKKTSRTLRT